MKKQAVTKQELKTLQFSFEVDTLNDTTKRIEQKAAVISFCIDACDMSIGSFSELETYIYNSELWVKVALGMKAIKDIDPMLITDEFYIAKWDKERFNTFAGILIDLLSFFCVSGENLLAHLRKSTFDSYADVRVLNELFCDVFSAFNESHTPSEIQHFTHKGRRFIVPYNGELIGEALTWGEATEALQCDYFTKPDENNKYPQGALLNNSLTILAAVCREVRMIDKEQGVYEEKALPPDMNEEAWAAHLKKQKAFFADVPCSVARDVGFFLTNSFIRFESIISLALLFKSPHWDAIATAMR
jgi:hypothetical protein